MKRLCLAVFLAVGSAACSSQSTNGVPELNAANASGAKVPIVAAKITAYKIPASGQFPAIVVGSDGALWFSSLSGNGIGRIAPPSTSNPSPRVTMYAANGPVGGMAADPNGDIWFSQLYPTQVGRITISTSSAPAFTYYPATIASTWSVALARDDGKLWLPSTANGTNTIGRFSIPNATRGATFTTVTVPTIHSDPWGITAGPEKAMWFTESSENRIGRIARDGTITEFRLQQGPGPTAITTGPYHTLWFAKHDEIGRIATDGTVAYFTIPPNEDLRAPFGIANGPDGALWWTSCRGNGALGRITTEGHISKIAFSEGENACPNGIVTGPDGALWVTMNSGGSTGLVLRVQLP